MSVDDRDFEEFKKARRSKAVLADPAKSDRLPPHSVEGEQGVLGCIMLSPAECMGQCIEKFKAGSLVFYELRHQTIYGTLLEMHEGHQSIDIITLQQVLRDRGRLEEVGGLPYLSSLPDCVPSAANLGYYLDIVREKFVLRRMIGTCTDIIARAYEHSGEVGSILDTVERDLGLLTETEGQSAEVSMLTVIKGNLKTLEEMHYSRGKTQLDGLPTGPEGNYLDKMLGGIAPEDYGVLAGRPGSGKTSKALNIVEYLANDYVWWEQTGAFHPLEGDEQVARPVMRQNKGVPVAIFSIEMTADSLGFRMLFSRAGVDMAQYKQGYRHVDDGKKLVVAAGALANERIYIDDSSAQSIGQIAAKARRMARQYGIKLFVLDYIQLVEQEGSNGFDRQKEITKISRKIMALKKQLKVPWIIIAQMNRDIEKAERERKPVMSDLKDCGALEQDADWLCFAYKTPRRELERVPDGEGARSDKDIIEMVTAKWQWEWSRVPYRVDFVMVKHRDGPTGEASEVFLKNLCRFEDWHQWKMRHNIEPPKQGERQPDTEEMPL